MSTIKELEAQLAAAKEEAKKADEESRKAQSERWKAITEDPESFEWEVTPKVRTNWQDPEIKTEGVSVHCRVKPELLEAWRAGGHAAFSTDMQTPERWFGMFYFRTEEGILTHDGGGHCVLKDPMLCNDEEWKSILEGNIPLKYRLRRR